MKKIYNIVFTKFDDEPTLVSFEELGDKVREYLSKEEGLTDEQIDELFEEKVLELDDGSTAWIVESVLVK
jgi:hypothetical protein